MPPRNTKTMTDNKRLIEVAFPLKQTSIDSVHEKNVRHGHISTLHIWPARRPLAASRAALLATLLAAPDEKKAREKLVEEIGGTLEERTEGGVTEYFTSGGVLRWCGDGEKKRGDLAKTELAKLRAEILRQNGGKPPKVLDLFAGGGAIPLEALRLGCDVTAVDYNPVAWFLLKCTLDYPQRLAGKRFPLPDAGATPATDMQPAQIAMEMAQQPALGDSIPAEGADLATHVRYWSDWVLARVRQELSAYYPTMPLPIKREEETEELPCPTVVYLWARTVPHRDPNKRGLLIPLLKTLWLCKKPGKKRALRLIYNEATNAFDFQIFMPQDDSEVGIGTMRRNGVYCPPVGDDIGETFLPSEYLQECGKRGAMGAVCTAVVVDVPRRPKGTLPATLNTEAAWGKRNLQEDKQGSLVGVEPTITRLGGKEYRLFTDAEREAVERASLALRELERVIPNGLPKEPLPPKETLGFRVPLYGLDTWDKLFTNRQLLALGTFVQQTRAAREAMSVNYVSLSDAERKTLTEAIEAYLAIGVDRLADRNSSIQAWDNTTECMGHTFTRFALPMLWDFGEPSIVSETLGSYSGAMEWVVRFLENISEIPSTARVHVLNQSAVDSVHENVFDAIVTDPPYYDAIPYADLSDFFYVWLKRTIGDLYPQEFSGELTPKPGELVQHTGRSADKHAARKQYEDGMADAFKNACRALKPDGRMVIVFAHKDPDAWETLVAAMIRAGFVITASWPIDTEMGNRTRAQNSAALSSSVWLVCRKRPKNAGEGLFSEIIEEMQTKIVERLDYFWDQEVSGPDFLWAAIGPGLESYSAFDSVVRNNGTEFKVDQFLKEVRRIATEYALSKVLHGGASGVDEWTRYALMHAQTFGREPAPVGECILLAGAYGLDTNALASAKGILRRGKSSEPKFSVESGDSSADTDDYGDPKAAGSALRLLRFDERLQPDLGEPRPDGKLPLIDQIHRLAREYASGDMGGFRDYRDRFALKENDLLWRVAQAFQTLAPDASKEKSVLEAILTQRNASGTPRPAPKPASTTGDMFAENS